MPCLLMGVEACEDMYVDLYRCVVWAGQWGRTGRKADDSTGRHPNTSTHSRRAIGRRVENEAETAQPPQGTRQKQHMCERTITETGYDPVGLHTSAVRRNVHCVCVLDEQGEVQTKGMRGGKGGAAVGVDKGRGELTCTQSLNRAAPSREAWIEGF